MKLGDRISFSSEELWYKGIPGTYMGKDDLGREWFKADTDLFGGGYSKNIWPSEHAGFETGKMLCSNWVIEDCKLEPLVEPEKKVNG